jgi:hypothetical protein
MSYSEVNCMLYMKILALFTASINLNPGFAMAV